MGALASLKSILFILYSVIGFFQETIVYGPDPVTNPIPKTPLLGDWAVFAYIVVTYHIILVILVINSEKKSGLSLPIGSTIITHLAFLAVVVCLSMGKRYFPLLGLVRYFIPGLAPFEAKWLFAGDMKKPERPAPAPKESAVAVEEAAPVSSADMADDYTAWLQYLSQKNPGARKRFNSVKEEYDSFMAARAKARAASAH